LTRWLPKAAIEDRRHSEAAEDNVRLAGWPSEFIPSSRLIEIELGPLRQEAAVALAERITGRPLSGELTALLY
jgi:hypothetical protein